MFCGDLKTFYEYWFAFSANWNKLLGDCNTFYSDFNTM